MDFQKMIEDNPNILIFLVCGIALLFVIGFIVAKVVGARKRKRLREEKGLVEIVFDADVRFASRMITDLQFSGYKIYSVNGLEPQIIGKGLIVRPGACSIEIEYIDSDYASRRRSLTTLHGKQVIELQVDEGKMYSMTFNEKTGEFEVQGR